MTLPRHIPPLLLLLSLCAVSHAATLPSVESCDSLHDCLHGFPGTVATLHCADSTCAAINPHWCATPSDCVPLTTCIASRCAHGTEGAPCDTRANCGIGLFCDDGRCRKGVVGTECSVTTGVQCTDGLTCDEGNECVPGEYNAPCLLHRNCMEGLYCADGRCAHGERSSTPVFFPWGTKPSARLSFSPTAAPVTQIRPVAWTGATLPTAEPEVIATTVAPIEIEMQSVTIGAVASAKPIPMDAQLEASVEPEVAPSMAPIASGESVPTAVPIASELTDLVTVGEVTAVPVPAKPSPGSAAYSPNPVSDVVIFLNSRRRT